MNLPYVIFEIEDNVGVRRNYKTLQNATECFANDTDDAIYEVTYVSLSNTNHESFDFGKKEKLSEKKVYDKTKGMEEWKSYSK